MFRYYVFAGHFHYPYGGMDDCRLRTNDLEEAKAKANDDRYEWSHVWDCIDNNIVCRRP